jgi:hypothetical protein
VAFAGYGSLLENLRAEGSEAPHVRAAYATTTRGLYFKVSYLFRTAG